jgi:hypothetical protein
VGFNHVLYQLSYLSITVALTYSTRAVASPHFEPELELESSYPAYKAGASPYMLLRHVLMREDLNHP